MTLNAATVIDMPPCPTLAGATEPPECARKVVLADALADWRREATFGTVDTGRYRCRYFAWGDGPPLTFVPGTCSDGETFVPLMHRLRRHFRCVGYDLPAGGPDGANLARYRHADLTADLLALLDHLRVQRTDLLGFSFGATVALDALARQPERFPRAILQGGFAHRPLAPAEVFVAHWLRYLPGALGRVPLLARVNARNQGEPFAGGPPERWRFFLERQGATALTAFAHRILMIHALDLRPRLSRITAPVLLVCGDRDPIVGRPCVEALRAGLPRAARAEIEGCGHHPHLSHPEVLAEVVRQFLQTPSCSG